MLVDITLDFATPHGRDPVASFEDSFALARRADAHDFAGVWVGEHHFDGNFSKSASPEMLLAAIARETKRLQLGFGIFPMPAHDPLRVAEKLATLDLLSHGRTMWAVGRGLSAMDLRGFGVTPDEALARMLDGLGELRNILIRGELDRDGMREPVNPTPDARLVRGWIACITSPTFALAADLGLDAMCGPYRPWPMAAQDLAQYRARFPHGQTSFTIGAFAHEDRAAARRMAGPGLAWMFQHILERSAPLVRAQIAPDDGTPFKWMLPLLDRPVSLPMLEALGLAIVGTPDDLVRGLEKMAATGLTRVSLMLGGGDVPREALLAACDLIGAKVLPRIAEPRIVPENLLA